ncbi:hypothetical protein ACIPIC_18385 [Streptomyces collinus]|uniref:hypothetical protein n=1 Tax=Streptomyces collinus TaxID=42684 RepID=UPI0037F6442F
MTDRTLVPGPLAVLVDDIRDHGYAIVQTRIERVPARYRSPNCAEPDGCTQAATLMTLAVAEVEDDAKAAGFRFERDGLGDIVRIATCDNHRTEASHDLYYALTGRTRPDGIRAFDLPGQHMQWT